MRNINGKLSHFFCMMYCVSHTSKPFLVFSPCSQPSQSITPEALLFSPLRRPTLEVIFPYVCCFFSLLQVYYKRIDLDCLWLARQVFGPVLIRQAVQGLCYSVFSYLICFAFLVSMRNINGKLSHFFCMKYCVSHTSKPFPVFSPRLHPLLLTALRCNCSFRCIAQSLMLLPRRI